MRRQRLLLRVICRLHFGQGVFAGRSAAAAAIMGWLLAGAGAWAQAPADSSEPPPTNLVPASTFNEERILWVMPDYQTVRDSSIPVAPLTPKQKWDLAWKETVDPFNFASVVVAAGFSQRGDQTPKYGEGGAAYGERIGAAFADFGTQNFFSAGLLANLLHQDPRYYRKGPATGVLKRVAYSVSRLAVTPTDSGRPVFNSSGVFGMMMGIAASNLYYPSASVRGTVMAGRLYTSLLGGVIGNVTSEFWPDIQKKFFHRKP
jgi:hypothetical protein